MNKNPENLREAFKSSALILVFEAMGTAILTIMYRIYLLLALRLKGPQGEAVEFEVRSSGLFMSFFFGYWVISFLSFHVTGAHFNPALSLAYLFKRDTGFSKILVFFYFIAQSIGAVAGALLAFLLTRTGGSLIIKDGEWKFAFQALTMEAVCTFLFVLVFLIQQDEKTRFSSDPAKNSLFLSIAYGSCVLLTYPISKGPLNPFIGTAVCFTDLFNGGGEKAIEFVWIYAAAPFIGALVSVFFYETVYKRIVVESAESLEMAEDYYYGRKGSQIEE